MVSIMALSLPVREWPWMLVYKPDFTEPYQSNPTQVNQQTLLQNLSLIPISHPHNKYSPMCK
jgi:hypothetical protein